MNAVQFMSLLHDIGIAWSVGGATVLGMMSWKAEKKAELLTAFNKFVPMLSKLILAGMGLLVVSGVVLVFVIPWDLDRTMLIVKIVITVALALNMFNLNKRLTPLMLKLAPKEEGETPSDEFNEARKSAKFAGMTNLALWYAIVIISVLLS